MRALIAAGGTGGHIYPAIAFAKALQEKDPSVEVLFVGMASGLEAKLVPEAGYPIQFIKVGRFNNVSYSEKIRTLLLFPFSLMFGFLLVRKLRPDFVYGVGGFVSVPVLLAASLMKYKTYIWEPNAFPGLANRLLARFVDRCFVVFNEARTHLKNQNCTQAHMPIRKEIESMPMRVPKSSRFRILVFGGSQGARPINRVLTEAVRANGQWLREVEIIHQTGGADFVSTKAIYDSLNLPSGTLQICEYIHDMPVKYAWADLVIARSGTGTISELAACGKAAILIPLPTAADDHQTKNALALVAIGGAKLLLQSELTVNKLTEEITHLKNHPEEIARLEMNIKKFHKPMAAQAIVTDILRDIEVGL